MISKVDIIYDFTHLTLSKSNYYDRKQISGCQELGMEEGLVAKGQHRGMFCGDIIRREFCLLIVVAVTQIYTCVNTHKRKYPFYSMII